MKTTIVSCDVCGHDNDQDNPVSTVKIPVVFETEQTEGRPTKPYISHETIDLCKQCVSRVIEQFPLRATGCQGHNSYRIVEK